MIQTTPTTEKADAGQNSANPIDLASGEIRNNYELYLALRAIGRFSIIRGGISPSCTIEGALAWALLACDAPQHIEVNQFIANKF